MHLITAVHSRDCCAQNQLPDFEITNYLCNAATLFHGPYLSALEIRSLYIKRYTNSAVYFTYFTISAGNRQTESYRPCMLSAALAYTNGVVTHGSNNLPHKLKGVRVYLYNVYRTLTPVRRITLKVILTSSFCNYIISLI